jgi:hypothetical protein
MRGTIRTNDGLEEGYNIPRWSVRNAAFTVISPSGMNALVTEVASLGEFKPLYPAVADEWEGAQTKFWWCRGFGG